ncbi:MAG: hypothetical protein ACOY40_03405 [Bacillota bacterium]
MGKIKKLDSPRAPGPEKRPVPWDDREGNTSLGELLIEKVEDMIDVEDKLV